MMSTIAPPKIAAVSAVLQPTSGLKAAPLTHWLPEFAPAPVWIPLSRENGVTKAIAILPDAAKYPQLVQAIAFQMGCSAAVEWQGTCCQLAGIEVYSGDLYLLEIPIFADKPLPPTLGRSIHALCFRWLEKANPALAERLHQAENMPLTLAAKQGTSRRQTFLRIGLLQGELLAPLLWGMSGDIGGDISLADIPCRLGKWLEIRQTNTLTALSQIAPQPEITLEFLSPTSFKQNGAIQPFPLPELVFSSLQRRWNAIAPEELKFPAIAWQGVTAACDIKTSALKMKGGVEIGVTGWARYQFPDSQQAKIATVLAHFATFAGIGRKTAMGMGQARLLSS